VGVKVDEAINPNSNTLSKTVAGVALGGTAALAIVLATLGVAFSLAGPITAIFLLSRWRSISSSFSSRTCRR
jgi:hypothetical protein